MFSGCFTLDSAWVSLSFLLIAAIAIHRRHPSLITLLNSASNDLSGGRRPAQIPQLDTTQASKESHNSIHNPNNYFQKGRLCTNHERSCFVEV